MKNLLLTSAGLTESMKKLFFDKLEKTPKDIKVLFVPEAASYRDDAREGIAVTIYELQNMGIQLGNITAYNLDYVLSKGYPRTYSQYVKEVPPQYRLMTVEEVMAYDVIFVCGGYSEFLLKQINRTGFDEVMKEAINRGMFYIGVSAGSMVATGNFATGLRVIENAVFAHSESDAPRGEILHDEAISLSNRQAILVSGERKMVIE